MIKNLTPYSEAAIDFGSRLWHQARERGTFPQLETSPVVTAMEAGGMMVTGVTNTSEFGLIDTTEPVLHGATRNPWNLEYTAGGSSGGSGAAVAAGIVTIAHGSDGGGSIRLPASQCGIFGLKPTRGRELGGPREILTLANELCLSRSVRDTAAFLSVVEDSSPSGLPGVGFVAGPAEHRLRIAMCLSAFDLEQPHPEVAEGVRRSAELCQELGHEVTEVPLPIDGAEFIDAFLGLWTTATKGLDAFVAGMLGPDTKPEDVLEPWTLGLHRIGLERGFDRCLERAERVFGDVNARMEKLFQEYDLLLSPVVRVPPFRLGEHDPAGDFDTVFERVFDAVGYTPLQNSAGMPGMSVPLHWTDDDLPVGSQFSAWRGGEALLLSLAYELEEARPWRDRTPPVFAG